DGRPPAEPGGGGPGGGGLGLRRHAGPRARVPGRALPGGPARRVGADRGGARRRAPAGARGRRVLACRAAARGGGAGLVVADDAATRPQDAPATAPVEDVNAGANVEIDDEMPRVHLTRRHALA